MTLLLKAARTVVAMIALCLAAGSGAAQTAAPPPNILLVIADDMGVDASPCYPVGDRKPEMPVLESLCRTGVVFDNVWSNPVCSPTRATILTGRYGFRTGVMTAVRGTAAPGIRLEELSLQRLMDQRLDAAYAHAVIGKWHLSDDSNGGADNPGLMGVGHYSGFLQYDGPIKYTNWDWTNDGETRPVEEYATTFFTDQAIDWVAAQDRPWFLWLAYTAPHPPFHLPPAGLHTRQDLSGDSADIAADPLPYYLAMMESLDSELGRLLASMPAAERDNTVIIFIGDNGTPGKVAQPPYDRRRAKGTIYQGGIHVPMVIAGAGVTRGGEREAALINSTDLFATIADIAGAGVPGFGDSFSFKPLLSGAPQATRDFLYAEIRDDDRSRQNGWTIRDSRYKLIQFETGRQSLFDLTADPFEQQDLLARDPAASDRLIADGLAQAAANLRGE